MDELSIRNTLPHHEIRLILRAADDIIAEGGRTLLCKILKGSRDKRLLALGLDKNPAYGSFSLLTLDEIRSKIDWLIRNGYLEIEYDGRLPLIVFSEQGWIIERDQRTDELLREWDAWIGHEVPEASMAYLKDRNRGMVALFLQKIKQTGDPKYIPLLKRWEQIDYKKVRAMIQDVIRHLQAQPSKVE